MQYKVENGIYKLNFELSKLEKQIINDCVSILERNNFQYLSIPSTILLSTFEKQQIKTDTFLYGKNDILAGSAEQGILEYFTNQYVEPMKIYSMNTCFRVEDKYEDLIRVKEFYKVEQYIFCHENNYEENMNILIHNALELLEKYNIEYRVIDVTKKDEGYHLKKLDVEVWTKKYGWMETHSCSYFGTEQSSRYNITGANHTLSNTGIATPRILIPLIERLQNEN